VGEIDRPISFLFGVELSDFWSVLVLHRVRRRAEVPGSGTGLEGRKEGKTDGWVLVRQEVEK
jgi:hypothetical protein